MPEQNKIDVETLSENERLILDDISVRLEFEEVRNKLLLEDQEDVDLVQPLFVHAVKIAKPKAIYRTVYIENINNDLVTINGTTFQSAIMADNFKDSHRVFAYVATCGIEVDEWSRGQSDYFISLWLDIIKEMILTDAMTQFADIITNKHSIERYSTMNPGSGDAGVWPIEQQRLLFGLIGDVQKDSGILLTDSYLMLPTKSVSGILFPSESGYVNCEVCTRENCRGRKAPYNQALA